MHYALLYLDTTHRIRIFKEGGYNLEKHVEGIGWCLEDDSIAWAGEVQAFTDLAGLCVKHATGYPAGRIETGPDDYNATFDFPT